jgi:hypothetical protein
MGLKYTDQKPAVVSDFDTSAEQSSAIRRVSIAEPALLSISILDHSVAVLGTLAAPVN